MPKEVLLYGSIYSWSASEFIEAINDTESEDITVRINSDGGEVRFGWGMIAKFSELTGKKLVKNDGGAHSMAAFFFCYADDAEAIDTADFTFHRAAYPSWIEQNPEYFDEDLKASLTRINNNLRKAFEAKIDVPLFEKLKNVTVDELFSMESRKDVTLTAQEAKKVGLINRVIPITPKKKAEIDAHLIQAAVKFPGHKEVAKEKEIIKNINKMEALTLEKLKAEHPAIYSEVFKAGELAGNAVGAKAEKDRIAAWMKFVSVDAKAVEAGIASGEVMSQAEMIDFLLKKQSPDALKDIKDDAVKNISTEQPKAELTAEEKAKADFKAEVLAHTTTLNSAK